MGPTVVFRVFRPEVGREAPRVLVIGSPEGRTGLPTALVLCFVATKDVFPALKAGSKLRTTLGHMAMDARLPGEIPRRTLFFSFRESLGDHAGLIHQILYIATRFIMVHKAWHEQ